MIRSLKRKFILLSMTSLFILLTVIIVGMNLINYRTVIAEADDVLAVLTQNKGRFPDAKPDKVDKLPANMSPETPYESRYFSVLLNEMGSIVHTDTGKIASVDSATAIRYATSVLQSGKEHGFIGNYRYIHHTEAGMSRIIFLDCGRRIEAFRTFLLTSTLMALMGFGIVFAVITILSGRILRPIAESYEKQKRFITDAGHEIKTPLTIINTNVDILEMDMVNNESLSDIKQQTAKLCSLTNDLVMLAKMEETENSPQKIDFPLSETALETVHPYQTMAECGGKRFLFHIQPMLTLRGNAKNMERLISILLDNAFKYSPAGGEIVLELYSHAKSIILTVHNTSAAEIRSEQLEHVFDRFYRTDASRNSETGGHGIGLSIAQAIVTAHGGKIHAWSTGEHSFGITAAFPL